MKWLLELLGVDPARAGGEMAEAVERLVEGTEPKLRLVTGYQKKLLPAMQTALEHIDATVEQIPGPLPVSRSNFVNDPEVHAYFASPDELQDVFSQSNELVSFFRDPANSAVDNGWAMLCVNKDEKAVLGPDLSGDEVRRDVLQTAMNFYDHKVMAPAGDEGAVRAGIKKCIFDGLITYALQHLAELKSQRRDLEDERRILHARLRARQAPGNGLSALMAAAQNSQDHAAAIEAELSATQRKLDRLPASENVLSFYLDEIKEILSHPEGFIHMNVACFRLTDMGIKVDSESSQRTSTVCFSELEVAQVLKRVVTIVRFPRSEMRSLYS